MPSSDSLSGLLKWLGREEWRGAFEEVLHQHLGPACETAGIEFDEIAGVLAQTSQCAPTARITSGGGFHPDSSRFDLVAGKWLGGVTGRAEALRQRPPWAVKQSDGP